MSSKRVTYLRESDYAHKHVEPPVILTRAERRRRREEVRAWFIVLGLILATIALLFGSRADAGEATIKCTVQPVRADGTQITEPAGVVFSYGTAPDQLTRTWKIAKTGDCSVTITGLAPGRWYFSAKMYTDAGERSPAPSNVVQRLIGADLPSPQLE